MFGSIDPSSCVAGLSGHPRLSWRSKQGVGARTRPGMTQKWYGGWSLFSVALLMLSPVKARWL